MAFTLKKRNVTGDKRRGENRTGIASFEYFSNLCPHALSSKDACVRSFFITTWFVSVFGRCFVSHSLSLSYYAIMGTHYLTHYAYYGSVNGGEQQQ